MSDPALEGSVLLTLAEVADMTRRALLACGVEQRNEASVTASIVAAEADGMHSQGLARLPIYCGHVKIGKVDGKARPVLESPKPGLVRVDAKGGFAHPAIDFGLPALCETVRTQGIAALAVTNSYNCGIVGYHVERIARQGFLALGFVNAPASIASADGSKPVFGTNPIAVAVPCEGHEPLVLDQSSSVVAKSEVGMLRQRGEPIPPDWALDRDGRRAIDTNGAGLALLVELFGPWLTAANLSIDTFSLTDNPGDSLRAGQFFVAIEVGSLAGEGAPKRLERLIAAIVSQPVARLANVRERAAGTGIIISRKLWDTINAYAKPA